MKKSTYIFLIVILFGVIYYPPIISINLIHPIAIIAYFWILMNRNRFVNLISNKNIFIILLILIIMLLDMVMVSWYHNTSMKNAIMDSFMWLFEITPVCLMVSEILRKNQIDFKGIINILLVVGNLQGFLSVLAWLNRDFQWWVITKLLDYGYNTSYVDMAAYRLYGFSHSMTFFMPVIQSLLFIFGLYLALENYKYFLSLPLLFISALINARTPLVVIAIGILILFVYELKQKRIRFNYRSFSIFMGILLVGSGLLYLFYKTILISSSTFNEWIMVGIEAVLAFLRGEKQGYFTYLDASRFSLPEGFSFLFGTGKTIIYGEVAGLQSDVGYINYIWMGGILYFILNFVLFFKIVITFIKANHHFITFIGWNLLFMVLVINVKGYLFSINEVTTVLFFLYIYYCVGRKNNRSSCPDKGGISLE